MNFDESGKEQKNKYVRESIYILYMYIYRVKTKIDDERNIYRIYKLWELQM